ncbi:Protein of unknown function [Selenomonas ruminantium]|uniref:DUF4127 family protein n=1 Tax=Selenomonas ruminantium TaxID=971 RepID=A0A1M6UGM8_SELRU|nr:DUF4127 family protein [Selenomonas ruminantium]SHK68374.1 Protein of unknown function [Selenomonas ruminantium]
MKQRWKQIFLGVILWGLALSVNVGEAAGKILFIPHDDRPISYHQTVDVLRQAGYEMVLPPQELLSNATNMGHPDELWQWLRENAPAADSAVIASDSMLYGGLIPSRKHEIPEEKLAERLAGFAQLRQANPQLHLYVFDSLMRTPAGGQEGDIEEPAYYARYGADFFHYSRLLDKQETEGLSKQEKKMLMERKDAIPAEYLQDWMARRNKNLAATKKLMDYARDGIIDYLILGRDDNAPLCQTHRENREILAYAAENKLPRTKFQSMPGIDEFNVLLLNRAVNDMNYEIPFVYVAYNEGKGGDTVPAFSDEKIMASVDAALAIAGGIKVPHPARADFVLLVNTDKRGKTINTHNRFPDGGDFQPKLTPDKSTKHFAELVEAYVAKGYPVGVADIKYSNGADNALLEQLRQKGLLFKLRAYSGWNTATNSTGFAIGTGMLAPKMTEAGKNRLLAVRYLDDWAYQANVRTEVGNELVKRFGNPSYYIKLQDKLSFAEQQNNERMQAFAAKNLPNFDFLQGFKVKNPWLRMFECDIVLAEPAK